MERSRNGGRADASAQWLFGRNLIFVSPCAVVEAVTEFEAILNVIKSYTDRKRIVVRTVLAVSLLLAFLASSFPLTTIASGPMCTLACCAGRPPHAAGSCMNGSCH